MARLALTSVVLAAAIALAATPTALAQKPGPAPAGFDQQIIYHSIELAGGGSSAFSVRCPTGWSVYDGGLWSDPSKATLVASGFGAGNTWSFNVTSTSSSTEIVTVWVACIRSKNPPKRAVKVIRGKLVAVRIDPLTGKVIRPRCPPRRKPAGFGWSLLGPNPEPLRVRVAADGDPARITGIRPTAAGHAVTVTAGDTPVDAELRELCLPETVRTRGGERRVTVDRHRVSGTAPAGTSMMSSSCGDGRTALGTPGFTTAPGVGVAPSIGPEGQVQLRVSNPTGGPVPVTMFLSCTRGRVARFTQTGITVDTTTGPITITQGP